MRTLFSVLTLLFISACSTQLSASHLIAMQIIDRNQGQPYATYAQAGRTYVAGNPGERYLIRLSNRSNERVLAVLSVDGINAISGETANPLQTGYVLPPYGSVEVAGWRKSTSEVAQFYFTALPDSYAARTQRPNDVGVIGVAAFREKISQPIPLPQISNLDDSARTAERKAAPAARLGAQGESTASAPALQKRLGTGHGEREYAPVSTVEFERRSNNPEQIVSLFYDSRPNLVARGIIPHPALHHLPQPFPQRFAPDPS